MGKDLGAEHWQRTEVVLAFGQRLCGLKGLVEATLVESLDDLDTAFLTILLAQLGCGKSMVTLHLIASGLATSQDPTLSV